MHYLGFILSQDGIHPQETKIQAILHMKPPQNKKQGQQFFGLVNFYKDLWPYWSHLIKPLTSLTGKSKFVWTANMHDAFDKVKQMVAKKTMLKYPDFQYKFITHNEARNVPLGATISQKGKPIAFF